MAFCRARNQCNSALGTCLSQTWPPSPFKDIVQWTYPHNILPDCDEKSHSRKHGYALGQMNFRLKWFPPKFLCFLCFRNLIFHVHKSLLLRELRKLRHKLGWNHFKLNLILTCNSYNYKTVKSEKILIANYSVKLWHFLDHTKWFYFLFIKEFIMAVFTASMSRDMSTHKLDYSFCCSSHRGGYVRENRKLNSIRLWTKGVGGGGGQSILLLKQLCNKHPWPLQSGYPSSARAFGFVAFSAFFLQLPHNLQKLRQLAQIGI